ncbi:hypothetical protein CR513_50911, partial [Mucuna pruriens]
MILIKVGEPSIRQNNFSLDNNSDAIQTDFDLVKEVNEQACIQQESKGRRDKLGRRRKTTSLHPFRIREAFDNDAY